jgi:nitroimidazol reductase NimA-like FMN-containing flavoprotein (pyridoxamine 5'-phosphate oxidase superfamily)
MREMRRKDRMGTQEDAVRILETGEYGVLSTTEMEGYPYGVPVNYYYKNGCLYIHGARDAGKKVEALRRNPRVSFTVCIGVQVKPEKFTTQFQSVICFGMAEELQGTEKKEALIGLIERFSPEFLEKGTDYVNQAWEKTTVFCIHIDAMTAKIHE